MSRWHCPLVRQIAYYLSRWSKQIDTCGLTTSAADVEPTIERHLFRLVITRQISILHIAQNHTIDFGGIEEIPAVRACGKDDQKDTWLRFDIQILESAPLTQMLQRPIQCSCHKPKQDSEA